MTSKRPEVSVTLKGCSTKLTRASRPKYSAAGFLFTVIWPDPGVRRTRATAFLRRPVPW